MTYTMLWDESADVALTSLWIAAADQQGVTDAARRIERTLKSNPDAKGVPFGDLFIYTDDPLAVPYSVDPGDRKVRIIAVKIIQ